MKEGVERARNNGMSKKCGKFAYEPMHIHVNVCASKQTHI